MRSIPIGDSGRENEVVESPVGLIGSDSRFVMFFGKCGDFIVIDNVVARRFGADDFLEFFFRGSGESFLECVVGRSLFSFSVDEVATFAKQSIFDDVVASVGESSVSLRSGFDGTMFVLEVEVATIGDARFLATGELDESMMMRTRMVFLAFLFVTGWEFVIFATDNDVAGFEGGDFIPKEIKQSVVIKIGVRVRQKDVFSLNFEIVRHVDRKFWGRRGV